MRCLFGQSSLHLGNVCPYSTKCSTTSKSRIDSIKLDIREKTKELKKRRDTCSNERSFSGYNRSSKPFPFKYLDKENINTSNIRECNIINSKSRNNEETVKAIIQKYRVDSKALKEANSRSKQFYSFIEKSNNGHLYKEHNKFGQVPFQTSENMSVSLHF